MRVAGATQCARNNDGDNTPAHEFKQHQRLGAGHHLSGEILDGRLRQKIHQPLKKGRLRIGHSAHMAKVL